MFCPFNFHFNFHFNFIFIEVPLLVDNETRYCNCPSISDQMENGNESL